MAMQSSSVTPSSLRAISSLAQPPASLSPPQCRPPLPPRRRQLSTSCASRNQAHPSASSSSLAQKYNTGTYDPLPALDASGQIPHAPYDQSPLALSSPEYPKGHIVLHPYTQPRPQDTWPASIDAVCPLYVELGKRIKSDLEGWGLSFSEGDARATEAYSRRQAGKELELRFPAWDSLTSKLERPTPGHETEQEEFLLHLYTGNGKHAVLGPYSLRTLPSSPGRLAAAVESALETAPLPSARYGPKNGVAEEAHIYICTHGSRDCRCGVVGGELLLSLQAAVRKHQLTTLQASSPGSPPPKRVKVYPISHIGGHKFAGNALVYPHGDWYGNLRPSDSPLLLRAALAPSTSRHDLTDQRERLVHWPRWRGRIGVGKERMQKVWDEWGGGSVQSAIVTPARRGARRGPPATSSPPPPPPPAVEEQPAPTPAAADPIMIPFRNHSGTVTLLSANLGETLKDVARRHNVEEIEATCDGKCECATCHAYLVQPAAATTATTKEGEELSEVDLNDEKSVPGKELMPEPSDEEMDMLDYAISRKPSSRLTCQVKVTLELVDWVRTKGGRVQLSRY
ncbi:hypothetical protein BDZ90DRAFT_257342 [Jaminaea rosea]|uniref:Uncharacterized protein n=1 Tax=Jaminaea rosea TaxID=1569628 RepID=A0A316V479_9BASI|nr:hypothetical protein BDZ90DRAFT_257342 [Jaminaea rosea]PWN30255.1 hypothetical protein BDZ90DRAFT_257342 [Jaminaea rosea]